MQPQALLDRRGDETRIVEEALLDLGPGEDLVEEVRQRHDRRVMAAGDEARDHRGRRDRLDAGGAELDQPDDGAQQRRRPDASSG